MNIPLIHIIGLGPGSIESITMGTMNILKKCKKNFFRTSMHPSIEYIKSQGIYFESFDNIYDKSNSFEEVYQSIADTIINEHAIHKEVCYAVPGNPKVAEKSVDIIIDICLYKNIEYKIYSAVSFLDVVFEKLNLDPVNGIQIINGAQIDKSIIDTRNGIIICQIYDEFIASDVKIFLNKIFNDDKEIYYLKSLGIDKEELIKKIPLMDIDKIKNIDHLTSIYVPTENEHKKHKYDIYDLNNIMAVLRGENGCPWDKKQTSKSIIKYMIEEVYELSDAIKNDDVDNIIEELGDVLLNIIFQCQLGNEEGIFDFLDVTDGICKKLIYRHPHVFGEKSAKNEQEVLLLWNDIKREEKKLKTYLDEIRNIPNSIPVTSRVVKALRILKNAGVDLPNIDEVKSGLNFEIVELYKKINEYNIENRSTILEKLGDVLLSVINLSESLNLDIEEALEISLGKFKKNLNL